MDKLFGYLIILAILVIFWVGLYHTAKYLMPWFVWLDKF
jgi:hypothetical protein